MKLLKVDTINEAKSRLDKLFSSMEWRSLELPVNKAVGRYLAEDITPKEDSPDFARAVVDGYAVRAKDTFGVSDSSPVFLNLVGAVEMGKPANFELKLGEAAYIPTGGMLPSGADAVVMVEYTDLLDEKTVSINRSAAPKQGVMSVGEDFSKGVMIYKKGHRIKPVDIAVLAAVGQAFVKVFDQPVVSIISTGDEIVSIIETPGPGKVRDVNSFGLSAMVEQTGCKVGGVFLIRDREEELIQTLHAAMGISDMVIISGGSSQGAKDYTARVIDAMGKPGVITHGLAMKPGKPTILGVVEDTHCQCCNRKTLVAGLPGHPVAAIMVYNVIVDWFVKKHFFGREGQPIVIRAALSENVAAGEGRETIIMVSLARNSTGAFEAQPVHAKSGAVSQLKDGDGYIMISSDSEGLKAGTEVDVVLIQQMM